MKSRIFMYLFIFSVLLIVFQYVNSKNILDKYESDIEILKKKKAECDSLTDQLTDTNLELSYFRIENNEDALSYFESFGYKTDDLIPIIKDELYNLNDYEGDDHPIVPYASMTENKILINKIRILNHKWLVANFTDGEHWGEIFVNYSIDENDDLKFTLTDYLMYPVNQF
ncbi:hydrolase [Winogradskyella sp. A3E31]|uniref:hydrolase n=1 Tax=Winogradskyella sp. A3E31 TaxID=3349637 RepID=UPI00398BA88A